MGWELVCSLAVRGIRLVLQASMAAPLRLAASDSTGLLLCRKSLANPHF